MAYLKINRISKAYKRYPRKIGRIAEWLGLGKRHELRWILRDLSFDIQSGEAVGILGINGAGKSTLLKIITGTTRATSGTIEAGGRISALLELGMGFHPDFTGRQNVTMAAQLHGISNEQITQKMQEIEEFAEIGDYIDQPVRTYSSGMQVRLAFSVATAVRPDILIVDEALSVGDTYFQHKSFDRIRQFREQGTTLLFVSHDPGAIKTLCNRAILLDAGGIVQDGAPEDVLDYYNALIAQKQASREIMQDEHGSGRKSTRSGSREAQIDAVELLVGGQPARALVSGQAATLRISSSTRLPVEELTVGILLRDRLGYDVFGTNTFFHDSSLTEVGGNERFTVDYLFPAMRLGAGSYSVTVALHSREAHVSANYDWWDRALVFQVVPAEGPFSLGVCNLPVQVEWREPQDPSSA
ncbi:MAG: transporter-like protein [Burkholderiaceae bacterium]|nr:transporter-like protein [Burkholderiaceae bacterium]